MRAEVVTFDGPGGEAFDRDVVRSPGAVVVVPVLFDAEGSAVVVMVRQWRASVERVLWELPAGLRDIPDEPEDQTAVRELREEVGYEPTSLVLLGRFLASPGMTDARHTYFLATGLRAVDRDVQGPEEQVMEVVHVPLTEALAMIEDGRIENAPAAIGLLLTARRMAGADAPDSRG